METHLLLKSTAGLSYVVRRTDIRRVYSTMNGSTWVVFEGARNTPICVAGKPEDFYNEYLVKKSGKR